MILTENYKKYLQIQSTKFFNNGPKYLDPFRKRLISVTPEEKVRLRTACFLKDVLGIPEDMIIIEDHLSHYGYKKNLRADIVVCPWNSKPLAVVECKSVSVGLSDQTLEQAIKYASLLSAKYVFICDGVNMFCYSKEEKGKRYVPQIGLPDYDEMIGGVHVPVKPRRKINRRTKISNSINYSDYYWCIGEDTPPEIRKCVINLAEAFLDTSRKIKPMTYNGIEFIEDLGLSYRRYGDASGGQFGTGDFRLLLVKFPNKKTYIFGLSIQVTNKTINDIKYGNSTGKSVLVVSVTNGKEDTVAVQINLNTFLDIKNDQILISHNGKFGIKKARCKEFVSKVQLSSPNLVSGGKVYLAELPIDQLLYIDQIEMMDFISNLLNYCNLRMKYKKSITRKRKSAKES